MRSRRTLASLIVAAQLLVLPALCAAPAAKKETVYITKSGDQFHRSSCQYVLKSKKAIKRSDAVKKGYKACKVCKP